MKHGNGLELNGRVALVTGGAQGIGVGICEGLLTAGATVAIVDLQIEKAHDVVARIAMDGRQAVAIEANIATKEGCKKAVSQTAEALGGIDILVNNAAPQRNFDIADNLSDADWTVHEQVILQAAVHLTNDALIHLTTSDAGSIVNVSSTVGSAIAIDQCSWPYHVSEAGLDHLTRWLAARLGKHGIRVNAVAPGLVDRDGAAHLSGRHLHRTVVETVVPLGRAGKAKDIAKAVAFLASEQSAYITGQVLTVDGGLGLSEVFGASLRACKVTMQNPAL